MTPRRSSARAIKTILAGHRAVAATEFVSSADALKRFGHLFPELARAAAGLGVSGLPASFEARLKTTTDPVGPELDPLVLALRRMPGVADVRYDRQWVDRLQIIVGRGASGRRRLALVLVLAAALTVASVVRLALHARRQEVEIMHLVGAPLAYIRGPFVVEGVLQGGLGALVALAFLIAFYGAARARVGDAAAVLPGLASATPAFLPAPGSRDSSPGECSSGASAARLPPTPPATLVTVDTSRSPSLHWFDVVAAWFPQGSACLASRPSSGSRAHVPPVLVPSPTSTAKRS